MGMDRCDQFLLVDCAPALDERDRNVGHVRAQLVLARGDHVGSQDRERVL